MPRQLIIGLCSVSPTVKREGGRERVSVGSLLSHTLMPHLIDHIFKSKTGIGEPCRDGCKAKHLAD